MKDAVGPTQIRRLTTPRAAAVAGILFAVLFAASISLMRVGLGDDPFVGNQWFERGADLVRTALVLMPFAGMAFLYFIGVVRDRLGEYEDRFFSTVFFGSGLLIPRHGVHLVRDRRRTPPLWRRRGPHRRCHRVRSGGDAADQQRLRPPDGRGVHDFSGHHLAAYRAHEAVDGDRDLGSCPGIAGHDQLQPVGHADLPGVGVSDQRGRTRTVRASRRWACPAPIWACRPRTPPLPSC